MIISMTGFATKTLLLTGKDKARTHLTITIKSLNSRFLEATCKLPFAFNHLETEFIKLFKKKLHRGNIIFIMHVSNQNVFKGSVEADRTMIKSYIAAIEDIKKEANITQPIGLQDILSLPNIFSVEEQTVDDKTKEFIFETVNTLIDQLIKTRASEGSALEADLLNRTKNMQSYITTIEKLAAKLAKERKSSAEKEIEQLEKESPELAQAQRTTLYINLDKMDIHEEIVRFKNHLKTFQDQIAAPHEEKGRRLDFILQELGRETNTIAAKCSDSEISSLAINIKVELEKAREQVQNIV